MSGYPKLVVVDDLHILRSFISPDEAHPKLIVDPDRILSITIATQSLKPTDARRCPDYRNQGRLTAGFAISSSAKI